MITATKFQDNSVGRSLSRHHWLDIAADTPAVQLHGYITSKDAMPRRAGTKKRRANQPTCGSQEHTESEHVTTSVNRRRQKRRGRGKRAGFATKNYGGEADHDSTIAKWIMIGSGSCDMVLLRILTSPRRHVESRIGVFVEPTEAPGYLGLAPAASIFQNSYDLSCS